MPRGKTNTILNNINLYAPWLPLPYQYKHTSSDNRNTESVNTHIAKRPVAISEQLLVRWQLIRTETINTVTLIVFTKI